MRQIKLLGIPYHFGQGKVGVKDAPEILRKAGLLSRLKKLAPVTDLGDLDFSLLDASMGPDQIKQVKAASHANELINHCLEAELSGHDFLLNVGGDHGMALGTIHGILKQRPDSIIIWADAHGDINTPETSPSGNFHGMPLAFLLGAAKNHPMFGWIKRTLAPHRLILFGPRDLDEGEIAIIRELKIQYYSSAEINAFGAARILKSAILTADPTEKAPIHLSFDVDIFDSQDVYSTGTRVPLGPHFQEVFKMGLFLGKTGRLRSMDVVEVNPEIGDEDEVCDTISMVLDFLDATIGEAFTVCENDNRFWAGFPRSSHFRPAFF